MNSKSIEILEALAEDIQKKCSKLAHKVSADANLKNSNSSFNRVAQDFAYIYIN